MSDDEVWFTRMLDWFPVVREWGERLERPDPVEPGSSLGKDDQGLPDYPVRNAAWYGLVTAVDHLATGAALLDKEEDDGGSVRPLSIFTIARAGLLGASQTVWVLTGNREERKGRALSVDSDNRKQYRRFLWDYMSDQFMKDNVPVGAMSQLERVSHRLSEELKALVSMRRNKPYAGDFSSTTMMREAAAHLARRLDTDEDWFRLILAYEWRVTSAAAHARTWPVNALSSKHVERANGERVTATTVSSENIGQSYCCAAIMTSEAWRLWDLRRRRHV